MKKLLLLGAMCLSLSACDFGEVDQGRCVAYNASDNTFTMVQDKKHDQTNPDYTGGVMTYTMPADPAEAGPEPKAGGRVKFEVFQTKTNEKGKVEYVLDEKNQHKLLDNPHIILFVDGDLVTLNIKVTKVVDVDAEETQLYEVPGKKETKKKFPDIKDGSITEYSKRMHKLITFELDEKDKAYLEKPRELWEAGDEVRIYYKPNAKHQALRFMNITQTNIFKK